MKKADLHIHSTVSDGSLGMEEIFQKAKEKGLDAVAITDHDTVSHWRKIKDPLWLKVIRGIEVSACDYRENKKVHILGYGIKNAEMVEEFVSPILAARHENSLKQIEILKKNGFSIREEELKKADGQYIYKQHIMEYLVRTGQAREMFGAFYQSVFKNHGICDFDITYCNPYEAVEVICQAGGKAVLAHSGQQKNFSLIPALTKCGLSGLELNHPANREPDKKIIREYAEKYGLFLTGGSDFHGAYENNSADIGEYLSEQSGLEALLE